MAKSELTDLLDSINKQFKKDYDQTAYFLEGPNSPTNIEDWVSTGSTLLDLAIANQPNGGLPVSRIIEITGLEQSGKSLLASHIVAETQRKGGIGIYIDTESSLNTRFLKAIGVDTEKMLYISMDAIEHVFDAIENVVNKVRQSDKDRLVTIVVDSVAGATTLSESASDYKRDGFATDKAIIMSKALRKITNLMARQKVLLVFTNQLRQKLDAMAFADPWTTSGGKSLAFHSTVRIRLKTIGKIKEKDENGNEQIVGVQVKAVVVKNRVGPPLREVTYNIYYDSGIDDNFSWLDSLKKFKIINVAGPWYSYVDKSTGEIIKFQKNGNNGFLSLLESNPHLKEQMYQDLCDSILTKYVNEEGEAKVRDLDDIEVEEKGEGIDD